MTSAGTRIATREGGDSCVRAVQVTSRRHPKVPLRLRLYRCCGSAGYLRTGEGACSIEIAYQAAEANRPGQGRAGSPLTKDPSQPEQMEAAKNPIGLASPRKRRPRRTDQDNRRVLLQVDRAEGLNVLIGCLTLESHRRNSGFSRQGSSRQAMVGGVKTGMPQCAGQERYTHRSRVVGTHMSWLIAFEDTVSPANCAASKTGGHIPDKQYRV